MPKIAIIGGSGLYKMDNIKIKEEKTINTPFGKPSDNIIIGELNGIELAFLPRHGRKHAIAPHEINYRANIYALKTLGVTQIISVSAVGSMKEEIVPGHMVCVDQFIDRTSGRKTTFFEDGIVAHVSFADPVCNCLQKKLVKAVKKTGTPVHDGGSYVCIDGPMFSSRAESKVFRSWGVSVIGMTNYQEAKLAREAEICYTTLALSTDYDCWHEGEDDVNAHAVVEIMNKNVKNAQNVLMELIPTLDENADCTCNNVLTTSIVTSQEFIPDETKKRLKPIIGKYIE